MRSAYLGRMPARPRFWSPAPPQFSRRAGYAAALLVPALVLLAELPLRPLVLFAPYLLFAVGTMSVAWLAGLGPALVSLALSAVLSNVFVVPPGAFATPVGLVGTGRLVVAGVITALLIASLRAAYAERAAQELRFRSLATAAAQTIWTTTPAGELVHDSPSWRAYTGQTYPEAAGEGWLAAVHPGDRDRVARAWREALASGRLYELEYRVRRPDGSFSPTLGRAVPIRGAEGQIVEWMGTNTDISTRRQAEQALRDSEERLRTLIETIPQIVFTSNLDGTSDFHNPQTLAYTGLSAQQLREWGWREVYHPDDLPEVLETYRRALAGDAPCTLGTFRLRRHDGAYRWFLISVGPLHDSEGRIVKWFGTATDIHEQKRWEEAQARAIEARDAFLSVASHELKTPVAAAMLHVQNVRRHLERGGDREALARRIVAAESSVERLGRLVEALLDVSRIAGGSLALERAPCDLSAAIAEVASGLHDQAARAGSELEIAVEPDVRVIGDRLRLEQVITNLLANAIRFGAGKPVRVSLHTRDDTTILQVSDHGIGIAPDDQARIFDRFERAVSVRNFGGLGLGLWISRHIVEASGGTLRVESAPGRGATFTVELPLAGYAEASEAHERPRAFREDESVRA
jgi:PAS domain S-box-containing protein